MTNTETTSQESTTWIKQLLQHLSTYITDKPQTKVKALAYPGLITLLDLSLYKSNEGHLTRTISSANILLGLFLELKKSSLTLLELTGKSYNYYTSYNTDDKSISPSNWIDSCDHFIRLCIECSINCIDRISTDRLSNSANLYMEDKGSLLSSFTERSSGGIDVKDGILESIGSMDYTIHNKLTQCLTNIDIWESPRLYCPDYIWADDVYNSCQKLIKMLLKHRFLSNVHTLADTQEEEVTYLYNTIDSILYLLTNKIPIRLHQLRVAVNADAILLKRLYLIKCNYRTPFRCFLEAHATLQRLPRLELLHEYLTLHHNGTKIEGKVVQAEKKLSKLLKNDVLVKALKYEQECEVLEVEMGKMLYPFSELGRFVDMKKGRIVPVVSLIDEDDLPFYRELLRRLKLILTRKVGQESSTGIRPILLDLQGIPRDYAPSSISPFNNNISKTSLFSSKNNKTLNQRLHSFTHKLDVLTQVIKKKGSFVVSSGDTKQHELEIPSSIIRDCIANLDIEMFIALYKDWYTMIQEQHTLLQSHNLQQLSQELHKAEIEVSIAKTNATSLQNVKQRIEHCEKDRSYKFEICVSILKDICSREMNLDLDLILPDKDLYLELPDVMDLDLKYGGIFGSVLLANGEVLP